MEEITREEFEAYEDVRASGVTNMFDTRCVSMLSGLDKNTIIAVMRQYSELVIKYPEVRK